MKSLVTTVFSMSAAGLLIPLLVAQTPSTSWTQLRDVELLEDLVRVRVANGKTNEPAGVIRQYYQSPIVPKEVLRPGGTHGIPMVITNTLGIRKIESVVDVTRRHSVRDQTIRVESHSARRPAPFSIGDLRFQWERVRAFSGPATLVTPQRDVAPLIIGGRPNALVIDRRVKTPPIEVK
jgi:hypothetical protein